jgi:superfamily I DNA/RNA helicase
MSEWDDFYLDEPEIPEPASKAVSLTNEQDKIAGHRYGPMIVLAGAGSGKTATLCARTGRLLESGVSPGSILFLTFSRKAATEIKHRQANLFGQDGADVRVDTFHGFGYRFMQLYKDLFGLSEDTRWAIMNESDQKRMLAEIGKPHCDEAGVEYKKFRKFLMDKFSHWSGMKQEGKCPRNRSDAIKYLAEFHQKKTGEAQMKVTQWDHLAAQTLVDYESEKRKGGYLDFDDLLLLPARALKQYPKIAEAMAFEHEYIMVDESQDTNLIQYLTVKMLGMHHGNVVMVGDDDQSIYGWRGAKVANLRRFMKDFDAPVQRLEQNFRSHHGIVETARKLISHNEARLPKQPFSKRQDGVPPVLDVAETDRDMARQICDRIQGLQKLGVPLADIAVLYRTNRMTQVLEPVLKQAGIPYSVVGGMSFYERAEVQAAVACVRICAKADDFHALRLLQPYIDGVGKKGMSEVIEGLKDHDKNLHDLALAPGDTARRYGKAALTLKKFLAGVICYTFLDNDEANRGPQESAEYLVQWMKDGPMKILDREKDDILRMKRDKNLEQLCFEIGQSGTDNWIEYLMEAPITDYVAEKADSDYLTLSTIHRSKGLEWPHVMIAGFSEGIMPMDRQATNPSAKPEANPVADEEDDGGKPEEERRTAYVAITRAAETCSVFHACEYRFPGSEPVRLDVSSYAKEMGLSLRPDQANLLGHSWDSGSDFEEPDTGNGVDAVFRGASMA